MLSIVLVAMVHRLRLLLRPQRRADADVVELERQLRTRRPGRFVCDDLVREEYAIEAMLAQKASLQRRAATLWLVAWAAALVVGFITKTTNESLASSR